MRSSKSKVTDVNVPLKKNRSQRHGVQGDLSVVGGWTTRLKNISQIGNLPHNWGEKKKCLKPSPSFGIVSFVGCWWEWILEQQIRGFFGVLDLHTLWHIVKKRLGTCFPSRKHAFLCKFKKTSTVLPSQPFMNLKLKKNISNLSWSLESFHFYRFQDVRTWLKGLCRHELGTQQEIQLLDFSIITNGIFESPEILRHTLINVLFWISIAFSMVNSLVSDQPDLRDTKFDNEHQSMNSTLTSSVCKRNIFQIFKS